MAKRGQQIDELYISLGLDIARLQLDFDTAGKTVSQAVARLGSKANQIKGTSKFQRFVQIIFIN